MGLLSSQAQLLELDEGLSELLVKLFQLAIVERRKGLGGLFGGLPLRCDRCGKERLSQQLGYSLLRLGDGNGHCSVVCGAGVLFGGGASDECLICWGVILLLFQELGSLNAPKIFGDIFVDGDEVSAQVVVDILVHLVVK